MKFESNSTVSAILARCLAEPEFGLKVSEDPVASLQDYELRSELLSAFAQFDFRKLELFGGLITQTQHNFLWETFPYSRALMKHYGIELSVFRSYRQQTEFQATVGLSRQKKIECFVNYLRGLLLGAKHELLYPGLLEVLTHERINWELGEVSVGHATGNPAILPTIPGRCRELDRLVPKFPETVRFAEYRYNPVEISAALKNNVFAPDCLKRRLIRLFYRMDPAAAQILVFEASATVWHLFKSVDGDRSVGSIVSAAASKGPKHEMRRYFKSAYIGGLIEFRWPL